MDGTASGPELFVELDGVPVPRSWMPDLSRTLLDLERSTPPEDRGILASLFAYLAKHGRTLREEAAIPASVQAPSRSIAAHPVAVTILAFREHRRDGMLPLLGIAVCAALEPGGVSRSRVSSLCSAIRGGMERSSGWPLLLAGVISISDLIRVLRVPTAESGLPNHVAQMWTSWLRDTLARWMLRGLQRAPQAPGALVSDQDPPNVPVGDSLVEDADLTVALTYVSDEEVVSDDELPADDSPSSVRSARALAAHLRRESDGDILSPPDAWIPAELIAELMGRSLQEARGALQMAALGDAECFLALALAAAGGLREIDLQLVRWGAHPDSLSFVLDPEVPVLYRPIRRPPNAVAPPAELRDWLKPNTETVAWPIPSLLHQLLSELATPSGRAPGVRVFPALTGQVELPYRLQDVIVRLMPDMRTGFLPIRFAMAADIARRFGPEVSQLALGDAFSMTTAPAYYAAIPETRIAEHVGAIQRRWFGKPSQIPAQRNGTIGSRLVLTDHAARAWAAAHLKLRHAVAHQDAASQWRAHRDRLASVLCVVTGHRPEDGIGLIRLYDVLPSSGLVILQDKQVDVRRATRVAATGRRWLTDLRAYLDRLADVSESFPMSAPGLLASAVLRGEAELFSAPMPNGEVSVMGSADLRASMPDELRTVANFYRHRLNQYLQQHDVDPELRHAQLGWIVSRTHSTADSSPIAPKALSKLLGPILDQLVVDDGWYGHSQRVQWHWDRVPMPPLKDWPALLAEARRQQDRELRALLERLRQRGREIERNVLPRLAEAVGDLIPPLRVDTEAVRLVLAQHDPSSRVVVPVTAEHHARICDRVRMRNEDTSSAIESIVTRLLLYKLVRRARDRGIIRGPIPTRPYLRLRAEPSPFMPGLGIALRHAEAVREAFLARAREQNARDQAYLATVAMLAYSPYRTVDAALSAVGNVADLMRSRAGHGLLRLSGSKGPSRIDIAVGGVPSLLLSRRSMDTQTARAPAIGRLGDWISTALPSGFPWPAGPRAVDALVGMFAAAARVELSGVERWMLEAGGLTATVSALRCVAHEDRWPVRTRALDDQRRRAATPAYVDGASTDPQGKAPVEPWREDYRRFVALLNPRTFRVQRADKAPRRERASDGKRAWRRDLAHALSDFAAKVGKRSNLGVLAGYSLEHVLHGSEAGRRLEHASLHREITRFSSSLLDILAGRTLLDLDASTLLEAYTAVLVSKSPTARPYTFEELRRFHRFMTRAHGLPEIAFADLAVLAGSRTTSVDAGLLTEAEIRLVVRQLRDDLATATANAEGDPATVRACELRLLLFLLLESSGIRPGSAYGLTLADLHFLGEGRDFVHVRTTGDYGEAKTSSAIGYVPLAGDLWLEHRSWAQDWIGRERSRCSPASGADLPLFAQEPGHRRRFAADELTRRFDALLKWASGDPDASTYWLRKNRVTQRYRALVRLPQPMARDVRDILGACGHSDIAVALAHYVNDPAAVLFTHRTDARDTPRRDILAVTGLAGPPLDMAWSRAPDIEGGKVPIVLDRTGIPFVEPDEENITPAPVLSSRTRLRPLHVAKYAHAMYAEPNRLAASGRAGLSEAQATSLDAAAHELLLLYGQAPWRTEGLRHRRAIMLRPRSLAGTEALFELLASEPGEDLSLLARIWASQGHLGRVHGTDVLMTLPTHDAREAARRVLGATQLGLNVINVGDVHLLQAHPRRQREKTHGAALRWVLAIIWIYLAISRHSRPE